MTTIGNTFGTSEPGLPDFLEQIHKGEIQLPDFQRDWVWDDYRIRSLIASVSLSYPIGVIMSLETGKDINFQCRAIEGAPAPASKQPSSLILDGQQRMTALYSVLRSGKDVLTRTSGGRKIKHVYYFNIAKCLDAEADREEEAVISLSSERKLVDFDRTVRIDASSPEKEYESGLFPLASLLDEKKFFSWQQGYINVFGLDSENVKKFNEFASNVRQCFLQYRFAMITLSNETSREAVCQVFEKVNTRGVTLTVFELMTATYAIDDFNLRKDWEQRKEKFAENENLNKILSSVEATDFLQAVTLLATKKRKDTAVSCKRKDIFKVTLAEYNENKLSIEQGFISAAKLLISEKIFDARSLPYRTQLVPLAAVCASLGGDYDNDTPKKKLVRWYWCGVFGELYAGSTETRAANDLVDLLVWLDGGKEPRSFVEANFSPARLISLQTRQSAAYKGMMALLMQLGSEDLITGNSAELINYYADNIDIHHIFPKSYCEKQKYSREFWNSIVNKVAISARTNRVLAGKAPSKYLEDITQRKKVEAARLAGFLTSHAINPSLLREDKFEEFIRDRATRLLRLIEKAMDKKISGLDSDEVIKAYGGKLTQPDR